MSRICTSILATLMSVAVLEWPSVEAQPASAKGTARERRPDFSGNWVLIEGLVTGATRDSAESSTPRRTSSTTVSGAAFNCGRECTIVHKGQVLTVTNAELADYPGKDKSRPTPAVTVQLDGRERKVVDSFSPSREIPATASWKGSKLEITSGTGSLVHNQLLSLEGKQLVVANVAQVNSERRGDVTYKYAKKVSH